MAYALSSAAALASEASDDAQPSATAQPSTETTHDPFRFVLVLRFALLNLIAFALLGVAHSQGLIERVIEADRTWLSLVIFIVFLFGLALCAVKVFQTSRDLNSARRLNPSSSDRLHYLKPLCAPAEPESRSILSGALRLKLSHRIVIVRHIANALVLLGLIGTVLGFIIALSGVDPDSAADLSNVAGMVSNLIAGMSTALYTTLVGAVLNMWLMANHQLLASGTVKLITTLLEATESHARN